MEGRGKNNLVLCPGFMNDRGLWAQMEKGLKGHGRCFFADQSQDASISGLAGRILRASPSQFVLIGFSMGGYIAREVLCLSPERVRGLVLINTSARPDSESIKERNRRLIDLTRKRGFHGLSESVLRRSLHPKRQDDRDLIDTLKSMARRMGEAAFVNQLSIERMDGRPTLRDISCPTLVVWAQQDRLRSLDEARELQNGIPGAQLEIIENSGHMTPFEQPEKLMATLLSWFSKVDL